MISLLKVSEENYKCEADKKRISNTLDFSNLGSNVTTMTPSNGDVALCEHVHTQAWHLCVAGCAALSSLTGKEIESIWSGPFLLRKVERQEIQVVPYVMYCLCNSSSSASGTTYVLWLVGSQQSQVSFLSFYFFQFFHIK